MIHLGLRLNESGKWNKTYTRLSQASQGKESHLTLAHTYSILLGNNHAFVL